VPLSPETARDIAAYLLLWPGKTSRVVKETSPPTREEIQTVSQRLKVTGIAEAATALLREKRCAVCHPGLGKSDPADLPVGLGKRGCLSGHSLPRFAVNESIRRAVAAFQAVASEEKYPSPFMERQRQLERAGCVRCHQRDTDQLSPLEKAATTLGGSGLETVPFQRVPRLPDPNQNFMRAHLLTAVRDGVSGLRPARYTYMMPAYGPAATELVQALAEGDGELPTSFDPSERPNSDPTLGSLH